MTTQQSGFNTLRGRSSGTVELEQPMRCSNSALPGLKIS